MEPPPQRRLNRGRVTATIVVAVVLVAAVIVLAVITQGGNGPSAPGVIVPPSPTALPSPPPSLAPPGVQRLPGVPLPGVVVHPTGPTP